MYSVGDREMVEVIVFAEGVTEEQFIKRVISPSLRAAQVFVKPQMLKTSKDASGGAVSFDRLKFNARNTLRQHPNVMLSTFLDLYGLDTSFPNFNEALQKTDVYDRTICLENALHAAIIEHVNCPASRFIPHIQPYEFEGLLFSDVAALSSVEPNLQLQASPLQDVRNAFETPEHINDSYETKPSSRLESILQPKYRKTRHGPLAAEKITLSKIETECVHFRRWMEKLRSLTTL
jgi:Domain of unknown function (DUF4276)